MHGIYIRNNTLLMTHSILPRCFLKILLPHTATLGTEKTTYLYRLRVNAETIFASIHFRGHSFPDCIAEG